MINETNYKKLKWYPNGQIQWRKIKMDKLHWAWLKNIGSIQVLKYLSVMNLVINIKKLKLPKNTALLVCLINK